MIDFFTFLGLFSILIWPAVFILAPIIGVVLFLVRRKKLVRELYPGKASIMDLVSEPEPLEYESEEQDETVVEELPFCQLFPVGPDMCLMIDHVEMCPDETALIRVVDDEGYTPLYKRKVRRDKAGNRFIVFNGANYYLDKNKTKPTVIRK